MCSGRAKVRAAEMERYAAYYRHLRAVAFVQNVLGEKRGYSGKTISMEGGITIHLQATRGAGGNVCKQTRRSVVPRPPRS